MPIIKQIRQTPAPATDTPDGDMPITAAELATVIGVDAVRAGHLLAAAWPMVERYAPLAPDGVLREAVVRCAGYLKEQTGRVGPVRRYRRHFNELCTNQHERASTLRGDGITDQLESAKGGLNMTRRFPDSITRLRETPADRNSAGEYVEGATVEINFPASVQPMSLTDADIAGGASLVERYKIYVPEADALRAAFDDSTADRVMIDGREFVVEESRSWAGSHTRATILRAS